MTLDEALEAVSLEIDLIPVGASNRPGRALLPTFLTIHNTGNSAAGADARAHSDYVKGPDARAREVSWHYTVDDRRAIRHIPDFEVGWHAGAGNACSIGIEVCQHKGIDQLAANDRAALLVAILMKQRRIPATRIVPHQHWTGKDCPRLLLGAPRGFQSFVDQVIAKAAAISGYVATGALTDDTQHRDCLITDTTTTGGSVPVINSVYPNSGYREDYFTVVIKGDSFTGSTGVHFGTGITTSAFTVVANGEIRVKIRIERVAVAGLRDVLVLSPYGPSNPGKFAVN